MDLDTMAVRSERAIQEYEKWLNDPLIDRKTKDELEAIRHQPKEIEDRFYKHLEFGTGGMRGVMGAGTNRINKYTIAKATQGLADLLLRKDAKDIVNANNVTNANHIANANNVVNANHIANDNKVTDAMESMKVSRAISSMNVAGTTKVVEATEDAGEAAGSKETTKTDHTSLPSVVIAYDSRHHSSEFALEAACVLAGNGIKVYLFSDMRPTPQLSFAVRYLRASAGIVITASHNPPEYNGYKVYGPSGGQLLPDEADRLIERVEQIHELAQVRRMEQEQAVKLGRIEWLQTEIDEAYVQKVVSNCIRPEAIQESRLNIVYTPLHGSGLVPVPQALRAAGFSHVQIVEEQAQPDGSFPTVASPNPEEREAFQLALQQAKQVEADIIIGTDPDCDRVGTLVKRADGEYAPLNGNEIGAILLEYILSSLLEKNKLPQDGAMVKTIVTGELGARIAERYGVQVFNTLTGFKYIGQKMDQFERAGTPQFLFGYEESYGFLIGTHSRDKDAVVASVLLCEAASYYKQQGQTLLDVLHELYKQYGVHLERQLSITRTGKEGMQKIVQTMEAWRKEHLEHIDGVAVVRKLDYATGIDDLPRENVIKYELEDGSWFCLRPSGTEPKLKAYFAVRRPTMSEAEQAMQRLQTFVGQRLED